MSKFNNAKKPNPALAKAKIAKELEKKLIDVRASSILHTTMCMSVMSTMILHDKFGFTHEQLENFAKFLSETADSMLSDYVSIDDMVDAINEEASVKLSKDDICKLYPSLSAYLSPDKDSKM